MLTVPCPHFLSQTGKDKLLFSDDLMQAIITVQHQCLNKALLEY